MIVIAGPCVIESEDMTLRIAERLALICRDLPVEFYFKASFDKMNRTSMDSYRGPGLIDGCEILSKVKEEIGCRLTTDFHNWLQAGTIAEVVDVVQIPAFLCRQADIVKSAGRTGKIVNIKKGPFMAPWDMEHAVQKAEAAGAEAVWVTERGSTFGYNRVVVDFTGISMMKKFAAKVIMDCTHTVQQPGGAGSSSSGCREFIPMMARCGIAAGADGLFVETHPDPAHALCDGPNMLKLDDFENLIKMVLRLRDAI